MRDAGPVRRVLIADDDPNLRELIVMNLQAEGLEVEAYANGKDACRAVPIMRPDLIILDVMMPERDGLTALAMLKGDPHTEHIPVVLLTAKATDAEVWAGWEAGADFYITKPFNFDELLHYVKYLSGQTESCVASNPPHGDVVV